MKTHSPRTTKRRGLATVELAVCLPVIALIVFASMEACSMIFLQETLQISAYETARFAVSPRSVSSDAISRGQSVLDDRGIQGGTITITPNDMRATDPGTLVVVEVEAPLDANRVMPAYFYGTRTLTAQVTMLRE